jgi:hypothetical protein
MEQNVSSSDYNSVTLIKFANSGTVKSVSGQSILKGCQESSGIPERRLGRILAGEWHQAEMLYNIAELSR